MVVALLLSASVFAGPTKGCVGGQAEYTFFNGKLKDILGDQKTDLKYQSLGFGINGAGYFGSKKSFGVGGSFGFSHWNAGDFGDEKVKDVFEDYYWVEGTVMF